MSDLQAIETENEIEVETEVIDEIIIDDEAIDGEEKPEVTDEAIEIKVEEGGQPSPRRLIRFDKRIKNKNAEIAQNEAELLAVREENRLLRLNAQQSNDPALKEPDENDFDSDSEYKTAKRAYNDKRIGDIAEKKAQALFEQSQQNMTLATQAQQTESGISEHYARADSLNVTNYDSLEGNATDILGEDFVKTIIASTEDSHRILASMGASPGKTAAIAQMLKNNPVKAFASALRFPINTALDSASLKKAPDPETQVDPGSGVSKSVRGPKGATYS